MPIPEARIRATAAQVPITDNETAVVVLGGHHRCDNAANFKNSNDDGGCDEIGHASMFLGGAPQPLFVYGAAR